MKMISIHRICQPQCYYSFKNRDLKNLSMLLFYLKLFNGQKFRRLLAEFMFMQYEKLPSHFPKWMCLLSFPSARSESSSFSTSSPYLSCLVSLILGMPIGVHWYLIVVLIHISWWPKMLNIFSCLASVIYPREIKTHAYRKMYVHEWL